MQRLAYTFFVLLLSLTTQAQQRTITGKITDNSRSEPLAGATVSLKGTPVNAVTDKDGNYKLVVNGNNAVLVISFVGFESRELPVNEKTTIDVQLESTSTSLNQVVVVGYGTLNK